MAGAWAATAAVRGGATVILVDIGYCGASGVTAASGPGHWWIPPDPPSARAAAVAQRLETGLGLGKAEWMHRILDATWRTLPTLAPHYRFGVDDAGRVNYRAVRGQEYMRALRAQIDALGVIVLDHHPALELLARADGSIGGARGLRRQQGGAPWQVRAGAVVLAAGGCAFLSGLLGSQNNTGDGYLMAAEAGAELSGMEFSAAFTIAPAHSTMTRTMSYAFATYYNEDGRELDAPPFGPAQTLYLAAAMRKSRVFCSLHRLPDDIRARLHTTSPNVPLVGDRLRTIDQRERAVTMRRLDHLARRRHRAPRQCDQDQGAVAAARRGVESVHRRQHGGRRLRQLLSLSAGRELTVSLSAPLRVFTPPASQVAYRYLPV